MNNKKNDNESVEENSPIPPTLNLGKKNSRDEGEHKGETERRSSKENVKELRILTFK